MGCSFAIVMCKFLFLFFLFIPVVQAETNSVCLKIFNENSYVHVAQINLSCSNLTFIGSSQQDNGMTVSEFAQKYQADVAINANFFKKDLGPLGLVITNGMRWGNTKDTRSRTIFACTADNKCIIEAKGQATKINPKWRIVISGWQYFNHKTSKFECAAQDKIGCSQDIFSGRHPRTMIGLDEKQNLLYLVVVEGRLLSFSGMNLDELANLATQLGVTKAINLDGGGSSTFVVGSRRLSDLPIFQGSERKVANHLGVSFTK